MDHMFTPEVFTFFKDLVGACGISGNSQEVQRLLEKRLQAPHIEVHADNWNLGIFHAVSNDKKDFKVMLNAHLDAVGMRVNYVDGHGFVYFKSVGGLDLLSLKGQKVKIMTREKVVCGLIQTQPIHHMSPSDREKVPTPEQFYIRTEFTGPIDQKSPIRVGDAIVFDEEVGQLGEHFLMGPGFDNRLGTLIVAELMRLLDPKDLRIALHMVAASGEEIGCRGIRAASQELKPDLAITLDVTTATDYPGADKKKLGASRVGGGPVIARGYNTRSIYNDQLIELAEKLEIPYQLRAEDITPTDGREIDEAGIPTLVVRVPGSMLHTANDTVCIQDIEWTMSLLVEFLKRLP